MMRSKCIKFFVAILLLSIVSCGPLRKGNSSVYGVANVTDVQTIVKDTLTMTEFRDGVAVAKYPALKLWKDTIIQDFESEKTYRHFYYVSPGKAIFTAKEIITESRDTFLIVQIRNITISESK